MRISLKELLNAKFNLLSMRELLIDAGEYDKIDEIEMLVHKINYNELNSQDWVKIQEYVIAREIIRERASFTGK